jgi:hypothetical protein
MRRRARPPWQRSRRAGGGSTPAPPTLQLDPLVRESRIVPTGGADWGMAMERFFEHTSTVVRNERIKLAALFWNITGAGLFVGAVAGAFFVRANFWPKFGIFVIGSLATF